VEKAGPLTASKENAMQKYKAYIVEETDTGFSGSIQTRSTADLPPGELLIEVAFSSLNYKDMLSAGGNRGVTKQYPHTPGIDAAGRVVESSGGEFQPGDEVIVTSYDLGMNTPGGFGRYIRVPEAWAVPLSAGLTLKEAMILGTAGLTAGICVQRMSGQVRPEDGDIAVTGATGGVGILSISILKKLGYRVLAVSGKSEAAEFLTSVGAAELLDRSELQDSSGRPLLKARFAGGIDTAGGQMLTTLIKSLKPMGAVSCCGNAASAELDLTVFPFILRGITLSGVSSQNYPMHLRRKMWKMLAGEWKPDNLEQITAEITLDGLPDALESMREGRHSGRTVVKLQD
jgi:acrylyl-CoA reductase (NADPH)